MRLLIKGNPSDGESFGRFVVVTLDEPEMDRIRSRVARFERETASDGALASMTYQTSTASFYDELELGIASDEVAEPASAWDLLKDDAMVLPDAYVLHGSPEPVGFSTMDIGSSGICWTAGSPAGPEGSETFPMTLDEIEALHARCAR